MVPHALLLSSPTYVNINNRYSSADWD